jgi:hypothetical protein
MESSFLILLHTQQGRLIFILIPTTASARASARAAAAATGAATVMNCFPYRHSLLSFIPSLSSKDVNMSYVLITVGLVFISIIHESILVLFVSSLS